MTRCKYLEIGFEENGRTKIKCVGSKDVCVKLYAECIVSETCWAGSTPTAR